MNRVFLLFSVVNALGNEEVFLKNVAALKKFKDIRVDIIVPKQIRYTSEVKSILKNVPKEFHVHYVNIRENNTGNDLIWQDYILFVEALMLSQHTLRKTRNCVILHGALNHSLTGIAALIQGHANYPVVCLPYYDKDGQSMGHDVLPTRHSSIIHDNIDHKGLIQNSRGVFPYACSINQYGLSKIESVEMRYNLKSEETLFTRIFIENGCGPIGVLNFELTALQ